MQYAPTQPPSGSSSNAAYVRVVNVRMSWRNVFVLIFKFSVAFVLIDAIVIVAFVAIIAALLNN